MRLGKAARLGEEEASSAGSSGRATATVAADAASAVRAVGATGPATSHDAASHGSTRAGSSVSEAVPQSAAQSDPLQAESGSQDNAQPGIVHSDAAASGAARTARSGAARVTWFGHSALLVELDGKTLLLDPMLGRAPSPVPWVGGRRYSAGLPAEPEQLPPIDAVILSHDHYDHLDYGTIRKLRHKVKHYYVPLGVGAHLRRWGVAEARITELDWWQEADADGLRLACTPAQHFSGRSLTDRGRTLWCSWVIAGAEQRLFFSGDSGYGAHFREIGERYGPFDLTMMECGQYDPRWADIHMLPEQTVQAQLDVRGKAMIPVHWGAFTLALHSWTDPVERVLRAAAEHELAVATPRIGETVEAGAEAYPMTPWWIEAERADAQAGTRHERPERERRMRKLCPPAK
ncbi:MBL fold metallo-hydrolase [Paenibacillus sp. IB182496]|uniref:MBL fold metallo-hydrolase n=2 Tax=Paenibacillus sabuli TaxID=2772509 RepID=A0A927BQJ8_9BACL|nr:MBL fold metallo-hydrolase [Paenibacillus sabuli]